VGAVGIAALAIARLDPDELARNEEQTGRELPPPEPAASNPPSKPVEPAAPGPRPRDPERASTRPAPTGIR